MSVDQVNLPQSIVAELGKTPCPCLYLMKKSTFLPDHPLKVV